jgi:hypothetical protein
MTAATNGKRTVLFLSANPKGTPQLRLDQEQREITDAWERSTHRDEFDFKPKTALRTSDLRRGLLDTKPEIVHFCGHGAGQNGIAVEDADGRTHLISSSALANLFQHFGHVKCVVLNACLSEAQADEMSKHVECVIGMSKSIGDKAALEFAKGFYDALFAGADFERCYAMGVSAIQLENIPEDATAVLKKKPGQS